MFSHTATIATSIMPKRIEAQQAAIDSWLKLGFEVVSVNQPGEVEHLHEAFPGVRFETVSRPETKLSKSPNVPLNEIFPVLAATSGRMCGIVNSDICFRVGNDFRSFIEENTAQKMVFGSRIDLDSDNHDFGKEYCIGFDYFFIDKDLIPLFPDADFCLGMPCWDYWVPIVLLVQGVTVKRLISPIAFHLKHSERWEQYLTMFSGRLLDSLKQLLDCNRESIKFSGRLLDSIKAGDTDKCFEIIHFILRYFVQSLSYAPSGRDEACVTINKAAFEDMKEKLIAYEERLAESRRLLADVYASNSWYLTEPLRWFKFKIKKIIR